MLLVSGCVLNIDCLIKKSYMAISICIGMHLPFRFATIWQPACLGCAHATFLPNCRKGRTGRPKRPFHQMKRAVLAARTAAGRAQWRRQQIKNLHRMQQGMCPAAMENGVMAFVSLHLFLLFGVIPVACHRYGGNFIFEPFPFIFAKGKGQCAQVLVKMRQFCRSGYRHNPRFFLQKPPESQLRRRHAIFASEALKHIYNAVVGPHSLYGA